MNDAMAQTKVEWGGWDILHYTLSQGYNNQDPRMRWGTPYTTSLFMSAVKMYFFYLEEAPEALVPFLSAPPYSSAQKYKEKAVAMTFDDKGVK